MGVNTCTDSMGPNAWLVIVLPGRSLTSGLLVAYSGTKSLRDCLWDALNVFHSTPVDSHTVVNDNVNLLSRRKLTSGLLVAYSGTRSLQDCLWVALNIFHSTVIATLTVITANLTQSHAVLSIHM